MGYGQLANGASSPAENPATRHEVTVVRPSRPPAPRPILERLYLFVCGHNTSRSPIAQVICNAEIVRQLGVKAVVKGVRAVSAGLSADPRQSMSEPARQALEKLGFGAHEHVPRTVSEVLVEQADVIFCMTEGQCRELEKRFPAAGSKIDRLDPISDLGDHNGRGADRFADTAERIRDAVKWRLGQDFGAAYAES